MCFDTVSFFKAFLGLRGFCSFCLSRLERKYVREDRDTGRLRRFYPLCFRERDSLILF